MIKVTKKKKTKKAKLTGRESVEAGCVVLNGVDRNMRQDGGAQSRDYRKK